MCLKGAKECREFEPDVQKLVSPSSNLPIIKGKDEAKLAS